MAIDEDIKDNIMLLMFVGGDTISGTLVVVLKYLFLNPHCLHKVIKSKGEYSTASLCVEIVVCKCAFSKDPQSILHAVPVMA